jgi:hypothetical protein
MAFTFYPAVAIFAVLVNVDELITRVAKSKSVTKRSEFRFCSAAVRWWAE